jgi:HAE1 family hydrophobic/amphiphilic exporter-1
MFLSDLSIKRPVFAAVMMLALVTLGIFSYRRLAIDMFPDVEIPVVSVLTEYPGASPETVEREVTKRIEEAVNPIAGVKHVISTSREGLSNVMIEFELEVKINEAAQECRAKISAIRNELPAGIQEPVIQKLDIAGSPVVSLAVRNPSLSPRELTTLVDRKVKRHLENVSGVGKVKIIGGSWREVSVNVDPARIEALGMGVDEVIAGLSGENVNTPLGRLNRQNSEVPLRVSGKPARVPDFSRMVVGRRGDQPIWLGEVAQVLDGIEEQRSLALVNGQPAITLDIMKQSKANTVAVVEAVKSEAAKLQAELPPGTEILPVRDGSTFIREAVEDVENTLIIGAILTVLIVFCFLNSWRSTVITGLTLPISVISAFIAMYFLGMTLNVLTLMALSLAIGLLIDDAIVVRENIVRHLERGEDHFTAARAGTAEIGLAVLATTMSIVAVFVPVAFMKGLIGRFFYQFGITVTFAVLVSLFVSFTLDPMLSSRWYDPDIERKGRRHQLARILDRFNAWFDRTADRYRSLILWALRNRRTVLVTALLAFAAGLGLFFRLESEFLPVWDRGEFQIRAKTAPDASIEETSLRLRQALDQLAQFPDIAHTYAAIAPADTDTVRDMLIFVKLKERSERTRPWRVLLADVRARLLEVPGIQISVEQDTDAMAQKPLQIHLRGEEIPRLKEYAAQLKQELYRIPGIVDLEVTLEQDLPEYRLVINRERAADVGLSTPHVVRTVGALVGGQAVTTYEDEDGEAVDVRVRLPQQLRQDIAQVVNLRLSVPRPDGRAALIPLADLARYERVATPSEINRQDLSRQVVLSANLDRLPLGTAGALALQAAKKVPMAPGYRVVLAGDTEQMEESFGYLAEALLLAVIFVYLILAAQFESFIDPLSIMLSLPLSVIGMAGMLSLTGDTANIMSLIGLILLMGLVTKNAILLIDFTKVLRARGLSREEALATAGRTRLRPIMMTTLAMIFGMLPLAFALGAGAEMRAPMARAVVGGLITSTILTLLVVPVVFTLLDDFAAWLRRRWNSGPVPAAAAVILVAVALTGLPAPAAAQNRPAETLTLEKALAIAAEKNRDIAKARAYRDWVQGKYLEERAAALPHFKIDSAVIRQSDSSLNSFFQGFFPTTQDVRTAELGVTQALFTWGKTGAAIRAAREGMATADDQLRLYRQAAFRDVSVAFYDVLLARELHAIAVQNLEQKERHLREAKVKYELGTATDYDVLAAEVAVKNARPEVIRAENLIRSSREKLDFLLAGEAAGWDVSGSLEINITPLPSYEEVLQAALQNRPELAELAHRAAVAKELIRIARADDKPQVEFRGTVGWKQLAAGGLQGTGKTWTAGLFLTFPFYDGLRTQGRTIQAESDQRTLEIQTARTRDAIRLEVRTAVDALREAGEIVNALAGTVAQARRLLRMAEQGFEFGVKTRLEVEDAQFNLSQAEAQLARAKRDYLAAQVGLEWVKGTL